MKTSNLTRKQALELLKQYNKEPFHIQHALTVEGVMRFAAGCSREVITRGAERLGWELNELFEKTILAMRSCEVSVAEAMKEYSA